MGEWEWDLQRATYVHTQLLHVDIEYVVAGVYMRGKGRQNPTRKLFSYNADLEGGRRNRKGNRERERERKAEGGGERMIHLSLLSIYHY